VPLTFGELISRARRHRWCNRDMARAKKVPVRRSLSALVLMPVALALAVPASAQQEKTEAPFGDKVSERIPMYHRAAPTVATSGPLGRLGLIEAKTVGFRSVINLAASSTVVAGIDDRTMAEYVVLRYYSISTSEPLPTAEQISEIRRIIGDPDNAPVLIYGEQDQAAAAWALVRAEAGVPSELALQEGKTAGLRRLLEPVRERLGANATPPSR
jgi:hypothetical protein